MDFAQKKLTKSEWESIEVRLPQKELDILNLVYEGYSNVNHSYNLNRSLLSYIKVENKGKMIHNYLFDIYFSKQVNEMCKTYDIPFVIPTFKKKDIAIKKIDKMRIENMESRLMKVKDDIFEFVLIDICEKLCQSYKKGKSHKYKYYYTLYHLIRKRIRNVNAVMTEFIHSVLSYYSSQGLETYKKYVMHAYEYIEQNDLLLQYNDNELYNHQKELFTCVKHETPKIILYQAPTGTGKTISPIGLASSHKVIFVCAAKHVGLQLAKACVNMKIPLAIAFGCKDPGDIRLHYNAAKEIVKNYKTGGIFRVDNSVGTKVQIIVSDVQSYIPAMNYLTAFNEPSTIVTYWDEPTISLDYETHEFHDVLQTNWTNNIIPNMVLSSATLPSMDEITNVVKSFKRKFDACNVFNIVSHDCKKTIPILNVENKVCLPHLLFTEKKALLACVKHCKSYKTLMRHFDVREIASFINYVYKNHMITKERYTIEEYFETFDDITIQSIKQYYLELLKHVAKVWSSHSDTYKNSVLPRYGSTIKLTTTDAHTLTDGPSIYLADNVELIAKYCLKLANIPVEEMENIMQRIHRNQEIIQDIHRLEKDMKEFNDKLSDADKSKDENESVSKTNAGILNDFAMKINALKRKILPISLPKRYIPNTKEHLSRYYGSPSESSFTADLHDSVLERIMLTNVPTIWKMLLMLGIGIFKEFEDVEYLEIMKKLANDQKLFMIIATSDYIYGTNYQFCHEYIGKDIIKNMTQEKAIQAFGRVGRQSLQKDYTIRIRDDTLLQKIFTHDPSKMEVIKMNQLFA